MVSTSLQPLRWPRSMFLYCDPTKWGAVMCFKNPFTGKSCVSTSPPSVLFAHCKRAQNPREKHASSMFDHGWRKDVRVSIKEPFPHYFTHSDSLLTQFPCQIGMLKSSFAVPKTYHPFGDIYSSSSSRCQSMDGKMNKRCHEHPPNPEFTLLAFWDIIPSLFQISKMPIKRLHKVPRPNCCRNLCLSKSYVFFFLRELVSDDASFQTKTKTFAQ